MLFKIKKRATIEMDYSKFGYELEKVYLDEREIYSTGYCTGGALYVARHWCNENGYSF